MGSVAPHLAPDIGPDLGRLASRNALGGPAETGKNIALRKPDHRLLRDLVGFEPFALAAAKRERGDQSQRRDGFAHCRPPSELGADVGASHAV